jgi:hypothetical protein
VNTPVKVESMVRFVVNLGVAGLLSVMVGCATHQASGGSASMAKPSTMSLDVAFVADPTSPSRTAIVVSPNEGDVSLEAVPVMPGQDKNWVTWTSERAFAIKFGPIDESCTGPRKKLGNEKDGWNDSKPVGNKHVYTLKLNPGKGNSRKEILGAKYSVKSPAGCDETQPGPNCVVLDPVIIVRY